VNPDGSDRRAMTAQGANEDPSWAPDGRHLVFAGTLRGYHALWILDTVSGRLRSLTVNNVDELPHWSDPVAAER
jgi:TolB protein